MTQQPEFLASLCFTREDRDIADEVSSLAALAKRCAAQLRFFEIIYVVPERDRIEVERCGPNLARAANLRILYVRNDVSLYRQRRIGAAEAIGDVVMLSGMREISDIDLIALIERAFSSGEILLATRGRPVRNGVFYSVLGAFSEHRVNGSDMRTIVLPRARLIQILARESATIDLRFEPKSGDRYVRVPTPHRSNRSTGQRHRWELLSEIVSNASTRFLRIYALISLIGAAAAATYVIYTVVAYLTLPHVASGWFTTNFTQGSFVSLLAVGLSIFSLALARLTEHRDSGVSMGIIDEVGNINFFHATHRFNVSLDGEASVSSELQDRDDSSSNRDR
jgi:hypothetical protein